MKGICRFEQCLKPRRTRGLCSAHYEQMRKGGEAALKPLQRQYHGLPQDVRFLKWVRMDGAHGCWTWLGYKNNKGYGQFNAGGSRPILAHRAAWELFNGPIPDNPESAYGTFYVLHHCDNGQCVNPEHLFLGDQQANVNDMQRKGRERKRGRRGVKNHNAKLSDEKVRAIRASRDSMSALARQFHVSRAVIYAVCRGNTWKHVDQGAL